jgi:aspartyl-tRNA synthetase
MEQAVVAAFEAVGDEPPSRPFQRISFDEAMAKFGNDRPDRRFGMEIQDATAITRNSEFGVFRSAPTVRYIVAPKAFSRAELGRLEDLAKEWGAKGLAYIVVDESGEVRSPIAKFLSEQELAVFKADPGSTLLFGAGDEAAVARVLGLLRLHLGRELDLIDTSRNDFHWVLDFPLFEQDDETGQWTFLHHPFTAPMPGQETWDESNPEGVRGQHYDLIQNGWELGSGSIRIHDVELQKRVFRTMGLGEEEAHSKFGFLLEALAMGAPPHGGFAMGIERFVAQLADEPDIRQVIAFPKVSSGSDPLTGAPTPMPNEVLRELGIQAIAPERSSSH